MQIESLKVFRDLVETSSFSKAARSNSITQSAVSQQVRGWEERFGLPLIDRSGKQFALTREGVLFYQTAKKMIDDFDAFQHGLAEMRNVVTGPIRVSAVYSVGLHELPPYLSAFLRAYPSVNVHVEYRRANQVYEDVAEGASDLGLVAFPVTRKGLRVETFRQDRLVLICSARHRLAGQKEIPIASVAKEKFIGFEPDIPTRKALDKIFKENGVEVNPVMEYDNVETVKRAVEVDAGVAIVPLASVEQELRNQTLRTVEFKEEKLYRPLGILYKGGRILSPAVRRFLDALKEEPSSF